MFWEGTQLCSSFLDVCLLLFRVGDGCASATCCVVTSWLIANSASNFRYKWNLSEVALDRRLDFFESNWAFFAGFGNTFLHWSSCDLHLAISLDSFIFIRRIIIFKATRICCYFCSQLL